MAELIDKGALLEQYGLKDATKYGNKDAKQQAHSYSTLMLYEIADMIDDMPTVTEAEIRNKAITEFAERLKKEISYRYGTREINGDYKPKEKTLTVIDEIAEQMRKGEKE